MRIVSDSGTSQVRHDDGAGGAMALIFELMGMPVYDGDRATPHAGSVGPQRKNRGG